MADMDYLAYLKTKTPEELLQIVGSIDRASAKDRYQQVLARISHVRQHDRTIFREKIRISSWLTVFYKYVVPAGYAAFSLFAVITLYSHLKNGDWEMVKPVIVILGNVVFYLLGRRLKTIYIDNEWLYCKGFRKQIKVP